MRGSGQGVRCGLDVLAEEGCRRLLGRRVGLITNHTGITRDRRGALEVLRGCGVNVVALFGPEHGIRGDHDETFRVASSVDEDSGLTVHSLFSTVQRPTAEMLQGVECLVFDIADVGVRYYTYTTTMVWCMEEAARHGIGFVVLDRPNPITGSRVEGPVLDPPFQSLPAYHPIPTRHGLTAGELARYSQETYGIGADLEVVACEGWRRDQWFDETGLPWVNPSPNLRNLNQTTLYTVTAGIEFADIAVGRGTDSPFEVFGAPWLDAHALAEELNALPELHLRFVPIEFTPRSHRHEGRRCHGCFLLTTDRERLRPVEANIHLTAAILRLHPGALELTRTAALLGGPQVAQGLLAGQPAEEIIAAWQPEVAAYLTRRGRVLVYA